MNESNYILGVDIGGTSVKIGVVKNGEVFESTSIRNLFKGNPSLLTSGIKDICDTYILKYNINKIGVGCPGDIFNGIVVFASNLGWKNYDILTDFKKTFPNCDILIDNDGNTSCQAEIKFGKLNNVSDGLFITIGKGIGGAIIIENKIFHGMHNQGGRFGHMVIHTNGRKCNCGRSGCYETYASVAGLLNTVKEVNSRWPKINERINVYKLSGFQIVKLIQQKNQIAIEALKKWHNDVAEGLLNLCHIFDPSTIVIAGGITESGLLDLNFIKTYLKEYGYEDCDVFLATFKGKTGLVGAACLFD